MRPARTPETPYAIARDVRGAGYGCPDPDGQVVRTREAPSGRRGHVSRKTGRISPVIAVDPGYAVDPVHPAPPDRPPSTDPPPNIRPSPLKREDLLHLQVGSNMDFKVDGNVYYFSIPFRKQFYLKFVTQIFAVRITSSRIFAVQITNR